MPTRKQRRRKAKELRHDWEYVYVDEEGREVEVGEAAGSSRGLRNGRAAERGRDGRGSTPAPARGIQPPSWRRVGKRGLIFAPLMFITVTLLAGDELTTAQKLSQTVFLLLVFLPFSYVMDLMTYRIWRKRSAASGPGDATKR